MLGLLFFLIAYVLWCKEQVDKYRYREKSRKEQWAEGNDFYWDNHGGMYYDGHKVVDTYKNGHDVLMDVKTHEILRDYTQERLDEEKKEEEERINKAKREGRAYYTKYMRGNRICFEMETNKPYKLDKVSIYVDMFKYRTEYRKYYMKPLINKNGIWLETYTCDFFNDEYTVISEDEYRKLGCKADF